MNPVAWIGSTLGVYWGNATALRDFRVQLRGNRSVILFALYLIVLIGVGLFVYWQTAGDRDMSVVEAQQQLQTFYEVIMAVLGSVIVLVAPALTATTVVMERQRKSLDLVFSAPVRAKYFLVGKMISSYRYTWMLLVLSLPVTATCVVLGGASWSDVLTAYVLLSLQALVMTSIGLLLSTISQKPVAAILYSYLATAVYLILTAPFGAIPMSTGREAVFLSCCSPFFVSVSASTYTVIGTTDVPNWILAGIAMLLVCKILVLTAGTYLSPYGGKELPSLRIHTLLYIGVIAWLLGDVMNAATMGASKSGTDLGVVYGTTFFWILCPLFIFMPFIACFGTDAEKRHFPNGAFKLRRILDGTPAGGLPYLLTLIGSAAVGMAWGCEFWSGHWPIASYWIFVAFTAGFWTLFWAISRFASSFFVGLKASRMIQIAAFFVLAILPVPFFSAVASESYQDSSQVASVWNYYWLRPLAGYDGTWNLVAAVEAAVFFILAIVIAAAAEVKVRKRLSPHAYAPPIQAA